MTDNRTGPQRKKHRRQRLFMEHGGQCYWCSKNLSVEECTLDHLMPRSRGGTDALKNLVIACAPCNWGRGSMAATPKTGFYTNDEWFPGVSG